LGNAYAVSDTKAYREARQRKRDVILPDGDRRIRPYYPNGHPVLRKIQA